MEIAKPSIQHAEPVLAVTDVVKTVNYYHDVLGFTDRWTWGEPVNHGGVSWAGTAFLQFSLQPENASQHPRDSLWFRVKELQALFAIHQQNNVEIVLPITKRPWGFAEYVVRDLNGFYLTFAEPASEHKKTSLRPSAISIISATPSKDDLQQLCEAVGWMPSTRAAMQLQIDSAVYSVVAEDLETNKIIGCAFILGDNKTIYYVKDVIVHPKWQCQGIGTAMMKNLMDWLNLNGTENATVGLYTGDHLANFYKQFGFTQACGMYKPLNPHKGT